MRIQAAGRWLALLLLGIAGVAGAAEPCGRNCEGNWVAAWGTAQQLVHPVRAIPAAVTPPARVAGQTVRMIARDFDAVTRDPAAPTKLRAGYDSGDHIHPNDAGNQAMADAIDLKLFR